MTTNYPAGTTPPDDVPPDADAAGCVWWWWIVILIIVILFIWWAGWGWGPSGGYWFRTRPATTQPVVTPAGPEGAAPQVGRSAAPLNSATPATAPAQ